jgi:hypothetical protein
MSGCRNRTASCKSTRTEGQFTLPTAWNIVVLRKVSSGDPDSGTAGSNLEKNGAHPASYPVRTRGSFPGGKAAGALSLPLTSIQCRDQILSGVLYCNFYFTSRRGLGIFLFTTGSRTALGPTQPPIQWLPGALSLGVKRPGREADYSPPSSVEVKEWVELYLHSSNTPSSHRV